MKTLLVTGTDTDVGKTWVSCSLLKSLKLNGVRLGAYKPVCSGATTASNGKTAWHDIDMLAKALGGNVDKQMICPQRFSASVAPNIAAELEGRTVDDVRLMSGIELWRPSADYLLVEGVGGLLCPLSDSTTVADFAVNLAAPVVIVAANRLGVINHTLLTYEAACLRGLRVAAVIVNDAVVAGDDKSRESNVRQLQHWLPDVSVLICRHSAEHIEDHHGLPVAAIELFDDKGG